MSNFRYTVESVVFPVKYVIRHSVGRVIWSYISTYIVGAAIPL
jgi:hypothetical protein